MRVQADLEAGHVCGTVGRCEDGPVTEQGTAAEGTAGPRPNQGNLRGLNKCSCLLVTCHGYSFFWAACPPTIRVRDTPRTPHLQEVRGAAVTGAEVTGAGGGAMQEVERLMEQESRRKEYHILQA